MLQLCLFILRIVCEQSKRRLRHLDRHKRNPLQEIKVGFVHAKEINKITNEFITNRLRRL